MLKVYKLRNLESHNCERWSNSRLYVELKSALVIYLFATHAHAKKLKTKVDRGSTTNYLNTVINDYKKWQSRFVHIRGREEIEEIDLYAKEMTDDDPESCKPVREGKIADIRREIPEHQMIILGAPGMGKSTTLQYLAYLDAQDILAKKTSEIRCPIFIELKLLAETDSIMQKITDKLGIEESYVIEHLKGGKVSLFLDGLNEIEKSIKQRTIIEIKKIIAQLPQLYMIISSRPQEYEHRYFDDTGGRRKIPVFMLQQMKQDQISDFIEKNCGSKSAKMALRDEFSRNQNWYDLVSTPLILYMLIQIVQSNRNKLPDNKATIIKEFIRNIYIREKKEKDATFDYETLHILLCHLGFETRTLADTNAALDRDEFILPILEERKKSYGLTVNLLDVLDKAVDLNILSKDENQYSFVHEVYQEYYAAEELIKRRYVV